MKTLVKIITNTSLGALLLVLIVGPVGVVARIGGLKPLLNLGSLLGARVNSSGETFSQIKSGEVNDLTIKTFWGKKATYEQAIELSNNTASTKTYQLQILDISGKDTEEQEVNVYFQKNQKQTLIMEPKEKAWIDIEVSAPHQTPSQTTTNLKIVIWTL